MTILFNQDVPNVGDTDYTSGQSATLNAQTEYRLVGLNLATWVGSPPYIEEPGIGGGNVTAVTNLDGSVTYGSAPHTITVDPAGNIVANVVSRVDSLSNLLNVIDAGDGEIAVSSDQDALVVFKGTPTATPTVYRKSKDIYVATYATAFEEDSIDPTSGLFVALPEIFPELNISSLVATVEVDVNISFAANASGTVRNLRLEGWTGVAWTALTGLLKVGVYSTTLPVYGRGKLVSNIVLGAYSKIRMTVRHDASATIIIKAEGGGLVRLSGA